MAARQLSKGSENEEVRELQEKVLDYQTEVGLDGTERREWCLNDISKSWWGCEVCVSHIHIGKSFSSNGIFEPFNSSPVLILSLHSLIWVGFTARSNKQETHVSASHPQFTSTDSCVFKKWRSSPSVMLTLIPFWSQRWRKVACNVVESFATNVLVILGSSGQTATLKASVHPMKLTVETVILWKREVLVGGLPS